MLKTMVGSKMFMAPEVLDMSSHSYPCDLWAIGIIIFMMLSANYPFDCNNLEYEIMNEPVIFYEGDWINISQICKDLIQGLL